MRVTVAGTARRRRCIRNEFRVAGSCELDRNAGIGIMPNGNSTSPTALTTNVSSQKTVGRMDSGVALIETRVQVAILPFAVTPTPPEVGNDVSRSRSPKSVRDFRRQIVLASRLERVTELHCLVSKRTYPGEPRMLMRAELWSAVIRGDVNGIVFAEFVDVSGTDLATIRTNRRAKLR